MSLTFHTHIIHYNEGEETLLRICVRASEFVMKLLTLVVPCYNSQDYMEHCIMSMVPAGDELDIIIVDDGSTDETPAIADRLAAAYPDRIRVVHQPNGGHGEGINTGIRCAEGLYMKTVDSDDRLDTEALRHLLDAIRSFPKEPHMPDMIVNDYVYDQVDRPAAFSVRYNHVFRPGHVETWESCHAFPIWKQFMIHSLAYRTQMLRDMHLELPKHTFYEDNLYIYQPLPYVKYIYYLPEPLYGYFIGRPDQSIHEDIILRRLDQCTNIAESMVTSYTLKELRALPRKLRNYMINNAAGQLFTVSSLQFIDHQKGLKYNTRMWKTIYDFDPELWKRMRRNPLCFITTLPGKLGQKLTVFFYRTGRKVISFT